MKHRLKSRLKAGLLRATAGSLAGLSLAGCASRDYSPLGSPTPMTRMTVATNPAPEVVALPSEPMPVLGLDHVETGPPPPKLTTNPPATLPVPAFSFGRGWIPLRVFAEHCGASTMERSASGGTVTYRLATRNGTAKLTVGSRLAQWNGIGLWLGFAPQMIQGEPFLNALDADKTLLPVAGNFAARLLAGRTIVLDPGHGGTDGGTRGARHQLEKIYTLDWALRTERWLTNAGWKVFLTRRTDVDVPLADRVTFADRVHADLFVSLHFNSTFPQTQASGIETYSLTPMGMPSTLARGYPDDERAIFPNNTHDVANQAWAFRLHQSLITATGARDDGVKRARFMGVLRYQNRPAVLIEGGFLSNPHEAAGIESSAHREVLARAVAEALK